MEENIERVRRKSQIYKVAFEEMTEEDLDAMIRKQGLVIDPAEQLQQRLNEATKRRQALLTEKELKRQKQKEEKAVRRKRQMEKIANERKHELIDTALWRKRQNDSRKDIQTMMDSLETKITKKRAEFEETLRQKMELESRMRNNKMKELRETIRNDSLQGRKELAETYAQRDEQLAQRQLQRREMERELVVERERKETARREAFQNKRLEKAKKIRDQEREKVMKESKVALPKPKQLSNSLSTASFASVRSSNQTQFGARPKTAGRPRGRLEGRRQSLESTSSPVLLEVIGRRPESAQGTAYTERAGFDVLAKEEWEIFSTLRGKKFIKGMLQVSFRPDPFSLLFVFKRDGETTAPIIRREVTSDSLQSLLKEGHSKAKCSSTICHGHSVFFGMARKMGMATEVYEHANTPCDNIASRFCVDCAASFCPDCFEHLHNPFEVEGDYFGVSEAQLRAIISTVDTDMHDSRAVTPPRDQGPMEQWFMGGSKPSLGVVINWLLCRSTLQPIRHRQDQPPQFSLIFENSLSGSHACDNCSQFI
eukprot:TRINITY_DN1636_c0_g1_i7.p1 TRINITY_DN1636_c0_g1~~TRINITY_DN1636_c0_g1_i7.p1  ORF type:complete len:539 (-),score=167.94 TRINITY_DN1636_c0_g1_i7:237-1853(-)